MSTAWWELTFPNHDNGLWPSGLMRVFQDLFNHGHEVIDSHRFLKRRDRPGLEGFLLYLLKVTNGHDDDGNC